jgi:hypothetical protein
MNENATTPNRDNPAAEIEKESRDADAGIPSTPTSSDGKHSKRSATSANAAERSTNLSGFLCRFGAFLVWAAIFGVAHTQAPLYYSNQNQYFLHGLAWAGKGDLQNDWLAQTLDPTPVFSAFVAAVARVADERIFYVFYILILGLYFHALVGLWPFVTRKDPLANSPKGERAASQPAWWAFTALFVFVHSGLIRLLSARLLDVDYPWYFQAGVAGQYVLGPVLQPSTTGVLLLVSVLAFVRGSPFWAATWAALTPTLHTTYLLPAGMFVFAYQVVLCCERRWKTALGIGVWAIALVAPIVSHVLATFGPTSPEQFAEAQRILARFRIPHHCVIQQWCDAIALAQAAWIVVGVTLARDLRLTIVLAVVFVLSLSLTLLQAALDHDTLALLFPWRASALLVPLATTIILARIVSRAASVNSLGSPPLLRAACVALLTVTTAAGVIIQVQHLGYVTPSEELPLLEFVREHRAKGDVYLLPFRAPNLAKGRRGSYSSTFQVLRNVPREHTIPIDLQRFRLATGAPIYVDFKSIPYKDVDVLEWYRRLMVNDRLTEDLEGRLDLLRAEMKAAGITHVVRPADQPLNIPGFQEIHHDRAYRAYRIAPPIAEE